MKRLIMMGLALLVGANAAFAGEPVANTNPALFYWQAFVSVWCFFAAAASVVILWHFARLRPVRPGIAGAW